MSKNNDTFSKTMLVVLSSCLICALVVSTSAIVLRPKQQEQRLLDQRRNILAAAGIAASEGDINKKYEQYIDARVIDLASGDFIELDGNVFNQYKAAKDPKDNVKVPAEKDVAGVRYIAKQANVYVAHDDAGNVESYIVPVHGQGLWSTMYAFLAVAPDGNTVKALVYYDQGETPGLGGEVQNPEWAGKWVGKELYDANGHAALQVVKGGAQPSNPNYVHQVDALSGATLTSNGVQHTITFWLSEMGFGPFLSKLQQGSLNHG